MSHTATLSHKQEQNWTSWLVISCLCYKVLVR